MKRSDRGEALFNKVKTSIKPVRKQGDPPEEDIETMDGYVCDLCLDVVKKARILQCPFCGRWVCRDQCYSSEEMCCISCGGVIRLMRESIVLGDISKEQEEEKKGRTLLKRKKKSTSKVEPKP